MDIANGKTRHVHYRDSKLTLMLKDSLGGNSKATMVATISPLSSSLPETMSTLRFASRAKLIKNRAQINQLVESANLQLMQEEIKRLKIELERYEQGRQYFNNHNTSNDDGGIDEGGGHTTITSSSTSLLPLPTSSSSATRIAFDTELLKILQQKCAAMETRLEKANHFVTNFQEISRRKDQQIQHDKMLLRLKDSQIERLRVSSSGGSKQSEDEAVVVDEEKVEIRKRKEIRGFQLNFLSLIFLSLYLGTTQTGNLHFKSILRSPPKPRRNSIRHPRSSITR